MFGGAGWTLRNGGHIRVQMLFAALPGGAQRSAEAARSIKELVARSGRPDTSRKAC